MKINKAIALYKKGISCISCCLLCAILALLLISSPVNAQEPILITPMEAEDIYESLYIDSVAVEDDTTDTSISEIKPELKPEPEPEIEPEPIAEIEL